MDNEYKNAKFAAQKYFNTWRVDLVGIRIYENQPFYVFKHGYGTKTGEYRAINQEIWVDPKSYTVASPPKA